MASGNTFGMNLAAARSKAGYSVETAARMLDIKPKVIEAWERGKAVPTDEELVLLSKLYSVELSALTAEGDDEKQQNPHIADSDVPPKKEDRSEFYAPHTQDDQRGSFSDYLEEGEELLWEGRPAPRWKYAKKFAARVLSALAPIPFFSLLMAADEIFFSSSSALTCRVCEIDGKAVGMKDEETFAKIRDAYQAELRAECGLK
jgi:transcriptional regulator with XRE-family HTH domain